MLRRRQLWVPTWRAWTLAFTSAAVVAFLFLWQIHPFLAVDDGKPGGLLVVEGWANDRTFQMAAAEFKRSTYDQLFVTGGPIEYGAPMYEYKNYAERGMFLLHTMGVSSNRITAVPAPLVKQDRTYVSAVTLHRWLNLHQTQATQIHLITEGAHARRSRLLLQKAFGPGVEVTVTSGEPLGYDPARWWRSSSGVRSVIGETIAYLYVRLLFWPERQSLWEPMPE